MIVVNADRTAASLEFPRLIAALRTMFAQGCAIPRRAHHRFDNGREPSRTLLLMPAWQSERYLGVKLVTVVPENAPRSLPSVMSSYLLHDAKTGAPLALIDGTVLTARRTAAASALAASYLARPDASRLLIVGAGQVARLLADAYHVVRPLGEIRVWNRTRKGARRLVTELSERGFNAHVAEDLAEAIAGADMVACATLAPSPLIEGRWLRPGTHLDLIGGFTPEMREADNDAVRVASVFVDSLAALSEAGDMIDPLRDGVMMETDVKATLADLSRGEHGGRHNAAEITLFKSVGLALEDLAAAILAYEDHLP